MASTQYDAIVIGGGPGGYPCAIRLGQLKQKVVCIEKEDVGGVCLNWGCIPSKALVAAAHTYDKSRHAAPMGITFGEVSIDVGKLQDWKGGIVKKLTQGVRGLLKANGAELLAGTARVVGPGRVEVTTKDGAKQVLEGKAIVVATGATTIEIPSFPFDGKQVIVADFSKPGRVVIFDPATGKPSWDYFFKEGEQALDHPSIARELPETGDVLIVDDLHDRVIVVDRKTKAIIWQYGVLGVKGHLPGYLNYPDGVDLDLYRDWKKALQKP